MDALSEEKIIVEVDEILRGRSGRERSRPCHRGDPAGRARPEGEVTLLVTDDEAVAAYNQEYRGVEGPTDVLSFAAQEPTPGFVSAPEMAAYLGDIVIALPFTRRQAAALNRPLIDELRLLAVHGVLHLLGYDHAEPEEEAIMWAKQDAILAGLAECSTTVES